jgi:tetratricopeptide (TPR) repeat protein
MATTILTRGQRRLHLVVLVLGLYLVANAAYLFAFPPAGGRLSPEGVRLPGFYQSMLVSHVLLGAVLLVPMTWFVVWHLRRALAMRNRRAIWTGVAITAASFALFVTGLFLFTKANSLENRWAFISHRVLALTIPAGYVWHRFVAHHRPAAWAVKWGTLSPLLLFGVFAGAHWATLPDARPAPQVRVDRPKEGHDPFRAKFPEYGVSAQAPSSVFFPAATTSGTGRFLRAGLLTNDELSTAEVLRKDIADAGFSVNARIGSETCARCHADIVEQWARSAHRFASFNNPFYRASVEAIRKEEDGKKRSQWCAGCHDPAIMMAGNMVQEIEPTVAESQAGLTCLACHLMDEVHGVAGNGNYRINDALPSPYLFDQAKGGVLAEVRDLLVKSKPDVHKLDMLKPVFRTSEYCGTCHKVSLDTPVNRYRWVRGQNEYDNHQDSGVSWNNARTFYLPPAPKACQDCHMPLVDAPRGDVAAKGGKVRSHLFMGPNTALPHVRGDTETVQAIEAFLKDAKLRVDVFALKQGDRVVEAPDARPAAIVAGEAAEIQVVVRNVGVGHTFPGGTLDSNEAWIHLAVADAADPARPLWESGGIDPATRYVDQTAHHYRALFVNEHSEEAWRRNPQDFRAIVHVKAIGPGTADVVRYGVTVPPEWAGRKLLVTATLKWRKFRQNYVEFAWKNTMQGRPLPVLPVTDIASGRAEFPVVGSAPETFPVPDAAFAKDTSWQRWNDWGIGLLLAGDTRGAERAFEVVRQRWPDKVDGWRNLARTKLSENAYRAALDLLQEAERRDPGNAQTAYFTGVALDGLGEYPSAVERFRWAARRFPDDRTIHQNLGRIHLRQGDLDAALASFLRVLAIDPEDRIAHQNRMLVYTAMADEAADEAQRTELRHAAAEARKAFEKYTLDESAQKWTNEFRRKRPDVNLESQPVHVHVLEPRP